MKKVRVTAYPYAVQFGEIEIPDNIPDDQADEYLREHWDSITFGDPDLDYGGTDFEYEIARDE